MLIWVSLIWVSFVEFSELFMHMKLRLDSWCVFFKYLNILKQK